MDEYRVFRCRKIGESGITAGRNKNRKYEYSFKIEDDHTLTFVEKESSVIKLTDERIGMPVADGAKFIREE